MDENQVLDIIGCWISYWILDTGYHTVTEGDLREESDESNTKVEEEDLEGDEDDMDSDNENDDDFSVPNDDSD